MPRIKLKLFPGMVFALIGINFCIVGVTVYAANFRHSSFVVETDYDRKALHWEDTARQLRHNSELGWRLQIDSTNKGQLRVSLSDTQGHPLEGATVSVEAFHHAHARSKIVATLSAAGPGQYLTPTSIDTSGLWEFRFTVNRSPDTFTQSLTRLVAPEPGGAS